MFVSTTVNCGYVCNVPRLLVLVIMVETLDFLRFFFCRYFAFFVIAPDERRGRPQIFVEGYKGFKERTGNFFSQHYT